MMMRKFFLLAMLALIAPTPPPPMFGVFMSPPSEIVTLNAQLTTGRAVIGVEFIDIATPNVRDRLQQFTDAGVVPFINIMLGNLPDQCPDLQAINAGACDTVIDEFVTGFLDWGGRAYIAPFPEMNGGWTSYGLQPWQYKAAYSRIRSAFVNRGVTQTRALFVFAPNAWSERGQEFENYYPGESLVDIVGLSFFSGLCSGGNFTTQDLYKNYLVRVKAMAPGKPVYLSQFGANTEQADFMAEFLPFLVEYGIGGVLWFSGQDGACDYRIADVAALDAALTGYATAPEWDRIFSSPPVRVCHATRRGRICFDKH